MRSFPDIAIIGPGKVGTSIGILAAKNGHRVVAIGGRDERKARDSAALIEGKPKAFNLYEAAKAAELVLLTVSDSAIGTICADLAQQKAFSPGQIVAHCSGALSSEVLAAARDLCGAQIASAHPLQMFPTVEAALKAIPGSHWFCEGEPGALLAIEQLITDIGGLPHLITAANKALYHCSSVMACNYLNALMDVALNVAEQAGLERDLAWKALTPLVQSTFANIDKLGTAKSLTGPIERGDAETISRHLQVLSNEDPEIAEVYKVLGKWTMRLALEKGSFTKEKERQISNLLTDWDKSDRKN